MTNSTDQSQEIENQQESVKLSELTIPATLAQGIYQYLSSKPAGETRQLLNLLDDLIEKAVEAAKQQKL